jgi:hypothetical protein
MKQKPQSRLTYAHLLDFLDEQAVVLASMVGGQVEPMPADVRARIASELYGPVIEILVQAGRRGGPLPPDEP